MSDSMTLTLFAHVHCMHGVLWDANAHAHCPLIEEMLMCMHIGWNTTISEYDSQLLYMY